MTNDFQGITYDYIPLLVGGVFITFMLWYLFFPAWPKSGKRIATQYVNEWTQIQCEINTCDSKEYLSVNQNGEVYCETHKPKGEVW